MSRCRPTSDEVGSTLIEALVALLVVGLAVAGAHVLHRTATWAQARAAVTLHALGIASSAIESVRLGLPTATADPTSDVTTVVTVGPVPATSWIPAACARGSDLDRIHASRSGIAPASADAARTVVVPIDAVGRVDPPADSRLRFTSAIDGAVASGFEFHLHRGDADVESVVTDARGCLHVPVSAGPVLIVPTDDSAVLMHPMVVSDHPSSVVIASSAARTGGLQVSATGVSGGVLPDMVVDGAFSWWVVDDPMRRIAAPEAVLTVPAGRRIVVVGVCADHRAGGSTAPADVDAGTGIAQVAVQLAALSVPVELAVAGRRLIIERERPCPGSSLRPRLRWDLAGTPMAAAVPDGRWQVRILGADGVTILGPATVTAAGPSPIAPPW